VLKAQEVSPVRLSVCVTVDVPTTDFTAIEEACVRAGRAAAREMMVQAVHRLEAGRGRRARKVRHGRRRRILTRAGYITITRGRARRADGTRYFPIDDRLGLPPHHESSPAVRRRGTHLAAQHPYREAARLLSAEVGEVVDWRAVWRWVQSDGDATLRARSEKVNAMFADGEAPPRPDGPVPEALTVAVDATGIRFTGKESGSVKVAVAFTGTEQVTGTKRRLARRWVFADIGDPDHFGRHLAYGMERTYGAHRIDALMLLGDGEPWIRHLGDDWLPTARYQCDHWHLAVHVREFCERDERRYRRMLDRAFSDPANVARQLRTGRWRGDLERAGELATYLENNGPFLGTYRRMGPGRWLHGSAPVEKHVELTVNRRFKRRGMRWSRTGARNLLAIRLEVIAAA
jgi:hypothetical protein